MRNRQAGFTLLELLIVVGLLGAFCSLVTAVLVEARRTASLSDSVAAEVTAAQRALANIERDIREADSVGDGVSGVRVEGKLSIASRDGPVEYRLRAGALERVLGGKHTVLLRRVAAFTATTEEGGLCRVNVRMEGTDASTKRRGIYETVAAPRAARSAR